MKWRHNGLPNGRISFGLRQSAEIVNGVFEAPDDPALAERLRRAGHVPIEKVQVEPPKAEEVTDGAPADDAERETVKPKKGR